VFGIPDERLDRGDKRPRDKPEVEAEYALEIQQCVESWGHFARFCGGDVDLRQSNLGCEFPLAPMMVMSCLDTQEI
jgi:hypothetical protein